MGQLKLVDVEQLGLHERMQHELSYYPVKTIKEDGSVAIHQELSSYFLENDVWSINFLGSIPQFEDTVNNYKYTSKNIRFRFSSRTVNLEAKYLIFNKIFTDSITLNTALISINHCLKKMAEFMDKKYPTLHSLLDIDIDKTEREWIFWLEEQGVATQATITHITYGQYKNKSSIVLFLRRFHSELSTLTDTREEWEKDRWDVRILNEKYGIDYNVTKTHYFIDFSKIESANIRQTVKKYVKQRLLSKNNFSVGRAQKYVLPLEGFFSFIFSLEPTWHDLSGLKRSHILQYIEWLNERTKNFKRRDSHPEHFVSESLNIVNKFLEDIQRYEYTIAPETSVSKIIFPEDSPKRKKKSIDQIDYISDFVLEQLFAHVNDLHKDVIPVVWVAFKTGLRISDVLGLTWDCLEQLNGKYSIVTDIEKTYVKGHRIPIDDELANILAVLIKQAKENSNIDNNPEGYVFIRYRGSRKGKPFSQLLVQVALNKLAHDKNIVDENGQLFHFKSHQFRHTYAVKMLNGGADILTVQELLAHASPEMTLRYARLLDETKRKTFEAVINQGVFSFDLNGEVQEVKPDQDIPEDILQALWRDHKLNAMDNPYGTCHARLKGNCPHMEAPPCLTCGTGGSPCSDLAIGFSELDVEKYEMHLKTTERAIEVSKQYGREDMAEKQQRNLERYRGILDSIRDGNIIFGRQERVKRTIGAQNV
ncbi:tyrosine-type recombinase/integrase [Brevibacillus fortis]|uniref:tyrosine-type recombinase/integrase n=1 Tax=Brevibacillus fortis TaxID=2126352 RepID=UPI0038FC6470